MADERERVEIYTDGACSGNPGPGGWGVILVHPSTGSRKERSGGERSTTNNRMELTAVIEGLRALSRPSRVEVFADSTYVLDGLSSWLDQWIRRGWKTAAKKPVKNEDLWRQLDELRRVHELSFHWIRGHTGHPENERADDLAVEQRDAHA